MRTLKVCIRMDKTKKRPQSNIKGRLKRSTCTSIRTPDLVIVCVCGCNRIGPLRALDSRTRKRLGSWWGPLDKPLAGVSLHCAVFGWLLNCVSQPGFELSTLTREDTRIMLSIVVNTKYQCLKSWLLCDIYTHIYIYIHNASGIAAVV